MVVGTLKKLLGIGVDREWASGVEVQDPVGTYGFPGPEIDYDEIIARLQVAKMEIDRMKYQLLSEIDKLNTRLLEAARRRNMDAMEEYAAEIVLKKKVLKSVIMYQKLINIAINRVNEARSIESLVKALAPLDYAMRGMNEFLYTMSPEIVTKLNAIKESTERLIRGTDMLADGLPRGRVNLGVDEEVKREIARALREAQVESDKLIPNIPIQGIAREKIKKRDLEKELLDYIKKSGGGVINLKKAAEELGVDVAELKKALYRLQEKGLIKVSRGSSLQEA
ncbi:MAG: hypothetical protein F7C08_01405 [Desulfurococcales archaeon]|nr:hypothetical protein [Desulfurococcales archaeon]